MNDHLDHDLPERLRRAVDGLSAPDVAARAITQGRRQRTRRRLAVGAGGVATATALALAVPAFAGVWPGDRSGQATPAAPAVAVDPSATTSGPTSTSTAPVETDPCGPSAVGWWSKPSPEIKAELSALLPDGTRVGRTDDRADGTWGGNLVTDGDADFASVTLLPPPGTPGGRLDLQELADGGPCFGGSNEPMQAVKPCDDVSAYTACDEIRTPDGELVGVLTEWVEQTILDGQESPTDRTYVLATVVAPDGGHVELYVGEGTRADRPDTVHDPADVPALSMQQARAIVLDPVWSS